MFNIGRYHAVVYSNFLHSVEPADGQELASIRSDLDCLGKLMADADFEWFLVGGVGLYLAADRFVRKHGDFDIEVSESDCDKLIDYMEDRSYPLMRGIISGKLPGKRWLMVFKEESRLEIAANPRKVRAVRTIDGRVESCEKDRMSHIDIHLTRMEGDMVITDNGFAVQASEYEHPTPYLTNSGYSIRTINPSFALKMKKARNNSKDLFDIETLAGVLTGTRELSSPIRK